MTTVEKVIESIRHRMAKADADYPDPTLTDDIEFILKEYEAAPKLPELVIPDWPEVWISLDHSGQCVLYDSEPYVKEMDIFGTREKYWSHYGTCSLYCGFFKIPEGVHWTNAKWRVK